MNSTTCAIVVTYNRIALLKECIGALLKSTVPTDVLVVDNASTDGTKEEVKKIIDTEGESGTVKYINTGANLGGAGGFNIGIRKAYEMGYEYFWLMDDDTVVSPEALAELFKAEKLLMGGGLWISFLKRLLHRRFIMSHERMHHCG